MMDTWMAPGPGREAAPGPVVAPGRAAPPDSVAVAKAKLQPTVYQPSPTTDQRHAA